MILDQYSLQLIRGLILLHLVFFISHLFVIVDASLGLMPSSKPVLLGHSQILLSLLQQALGLGQIILAHFQLILRISHLLNINIFGNGELKLILHASIPLGLEFLFIFDNGLQSIIEFVYSNVLGLLRIVYLNKVLLSLLLQVFHRLI